MTEFPSKINIVGKAYILSVVALLYFFLKRIDLFKINKIAYVARKLRAFSVLLESVELKSV